MNALKFNVEDPFPLVDEEQASYEQAKLHAAQVDQWLGLKSTDAEKEIFKNPDYKNINAEYWMGLDVQTIMTPYCEIRWMLSQLPLQSEERVIDLGAGYGRMGHVIGRHYPQVYFSGFESVKERFLEAKKSLEKFSYSLVQMHNVDIAAKDFTPPKAEYYFIYDFGHRTAIEKILQDLKLIAREQKICVIGRGRSTRQQIQIDHPWLSQVIEPRHFKHFSIYSS